LNFLNCQFDAGFSSLRMEHWKNFLRWVISLLFRHISYFRRRITQCFTLIHYDDYWT
jgi:hypothetical protein